MACDSKPAGAVCSGWMSRSLSGSLGMRRTCWLSSVLWSTVSTEITVAMPSAMPSTESSVAAGRKTRCRQARSRISRTAPASDAQRRERRGDAGRGHGLSGEALLLVELAVLEEVDLVRVGLSLIHISEPTRLLSISYAVF